MTSLLSALRSVDVALFHRINQVWTHPWLDAFFPWLTDLNHNKIALWGALPVILAWWLYVQRGRAVKVILAMAIAIGICDAVCFRFIKPLVHRNRPSASVSAAVRTSRPGTYGFPSNHACNSFAGATVLGMADAPLLWPAMIVAGLVAYSRVYVGVHFPFDVLAGALLGLLVGGVVGSGLVQFGGLRSSRSRKKP